MLKMTVKEWVEEYRRNSEWEQAERIQRLPTEPVEDSVRSYFNLCRTMLEISRAAEEDDSLREYRARYYLQLEEKWSRLASRLRYVAKP